MTTTDPTTPDHEGPGGIEEQHADIRKVLLALDESTHLADVLAVLRRLRGVLVPHFAAEERPGGLYESVLAGAPRIAGQLDRLLAEHTELLIELDDVLDEIQTCLTGPVARIMRRTQGLKERLSLHEEAEGEVVAEALYQDLGCGD